MKKSKFSEAQIAAALRQMEAGAPIPEERVAKQCGYPKIITVDYGSECTSQALDAWAYAHEVKLDFIRPGKPVENAVIESFNGRFRVECLNAQVFVSVHDARQKIEAWRID